MGEAYDRHRPLDSAAQSTRPTRPTADLLVLIGVLEIGKADLTYGQGLCRLVERGTTSAPVG